MTLAVIIVVLAITLAVLTQGNPSRLRAYYESRLATAPARLPPATVIVPVKGPEEDLARNLAALAALDYPSFELIVAARAQSDIPEGVVPPSARVVIAAKPEPNTGDKINNLLAAVRAARKESEVFAFADSDGFVPPGWLTALVAPLDEPAVGASTGYRFHLPSGGFWPLVRSVWNGVIAGGFGSADNSFCWGGAMAITRANFRKTKVDEYWRGAISDDYKLSQAVHASGLTIAFAPGALTADTSSTTAAEFLPWSVRQLIITRVYSPKLWWLGLVSHALYCFSMIAAVYLMAHGYALGALGLGAQWYLGMKKGWLRTALIRDAMPSHRAWFRRHAWLHCALLPLTTWIWFYGFLASARSSVIAWRGVRYHITANQTRRL